MSLPYFFKKTLLLVLFAIVLFPLATEARLENSKPDQSFVFVRIVLNNNDMAKDATITFEMCINDINTSYSKDLNVYQYPLNGPITTFKVPLNSAINYGTINFSSSSPHPSLHKSLYLFEKGDSIVIHINADEITFSGKGNEKYSCLTKLNQKDHGEVYNLGNPITPDMQQGELIQSYFDKEHLFYQQKLEILTRYRHQLGDEIYFLIGADLWGAYNDRLTTVLYSKSIPYRKRANKWHDIVEKAYQDLQSKMDTNKFSRNILLRSYRYCDFLYKRAKFATILTSRPEGQYYNLNYPFKGVFERIKDKYKGIINDKLILISFLAERNRRSDINQYYINAIADISENNFKAALQTLAELSSSNAFPFELSDEKGTVHKLSDFSGKLLIMDFWFTGCSGCSALAEQMKPIIASYKKNPNIVFVTVSVDRDKKTWIKSIREGKYSSPHELNLFTDGLATNHPMVRHYKITGFPFLLIISKKGKVISTAPPRPSKNIPDSDNTFKEFINQYL